MNCRSCNAPIQWVRTEAGKSTPVDAEPVEDGNIVLSVRSEGTFAMVQTKEQIEKLKAQAKATGQEHRLFKSHFATCNQADKWRR